MHGHACYNVRRVCVCVCVCPLTCPLTCVCVCPLMYVCVHAWPDAPLLWQRLEAQGRSSLQRARLHDGAELSEGAVL